MNLKQAKIIHNQMQKDQHHQHNNYDYLYILVNYILFNKIPWRSHLNL